jgi:hypothetical protein
MILGQWYWCTDIQTIVLVHSPRYDITIVQRYLCHVIGIGAVVLVQSYWCNIIGEMVLMHCIVSVILVHDVGIMVSLRWYW